MSTILDALRKVERERDPAAEPAIEGPTISPEVRRRRPFPFAAVTICAVIGFAGGALLSWMTSEPAVEVASLPVPPPAPEIAVPRAPARVVAPPEPAVAEAAKADVASAPAAVAPSAMPAVAAPPAELTEPAPAGEVAPPTEITRPALPEQGPQVAAIEKESALEPSPFGPARDALRDSAPAKQAAIEKPPIAAPDRDVAALAPPVPPEPRAEAPEPAAEPEPEPEPEAPAETRFDTGRSPPGAPKVALSFLQWSVDPARRFAFISIDGAPTQRVHEGEVTAGLTVAAITPTGVQFKREGTIFVIRPRH